MALAEMIAADFQNAPLADWGEAITYTHSGISAPIALSAVWAPVSYNQPTGNGLGDVASVEIAAADLLDGATLVSPQRAGTVVRAPGEANETTWSVREVDEGAQSWRLTVARLVGGAVMLKTTMQTSAVHGFARAFDKGHRDSLNRAGRAVGFWMRQEMQRRMRSGADVNTLRPLTRRLRPGRQNQALKILAAATTYTVRQVRGGLTILVGPDAPGGKPVSRYLAEHVVGGRGWVVTRKVQGAIAERIRQRGGSGSFGRGRNKQSAVPRLGRRIEVPARPYAERFGAYILPKARENLARLYATAQRGERWARDWYK